MKYCKLGTLTADIGPGPDNPRNSEGTFAVLPGGEILFVYSRFRGDSWADEAFADLALMRSADGGRTWRDEGVILTCGGEGGVNMMCPSLLPMENGDVGLFYLVRLTYTRTRIFLRRSSDGGRSWGDRVACTPNLLINLIFGTFVEAAYPFMFSSKKVFASVIAASTLTGLLIGLLDVKCTAYVPCFLAPMMTNDKVVESVICMVFAVACAFVLTLLCNKMEKGKENG